MNVKQCQFIEAWIGQCKKVPAAGLDMCDEHKGRTCVSCKKKAVRNCEHTGALVCGADLCATCTHGVTMPGTPYTFMGMGGGHVTKEKYQELMKEHERISASLLHWQTTIGNDCAAQGKYGRYYVMEVGTASGNFDARYESESLINPDDARRTKEHCIKLCQEHNTKLYEARDPLGTVRWTRPWYGVTHLTKSNNVASLTVHEEFTIGFFYVRRSGQCPWTQPQHIFLPRDGEATTRDVEDGGREVITHNVGKGQSHEAHAKAWAERMVNG